MCVDIFTVICIGTILFHLDKGLIKNVISYIVIVISLPSLDSSRWVLGYNGPTGIHINSEYIVRLSG